MEQLKKQIRESFFNPILNFLPVLIFIVVDDFWDETTAWKVSFPIAFALIFYIYFRYKRIFMWHGFLSLGYLLIGLTSSLLPDGYGVTKYIDEILFLLLLLFMFARKSVFEKMALNALPHELPMSNNENELFRVAKILMVIVTIYLALWVFDDIRTTGDKVLMPVCIKYIYVCSILFVGIYETFRVILVRTRLINEDWLPIVNDKGKVIGSIQNNTDNESGKRLMYPTVRLYFIENANILLQLRKPDDVSEPLLWDASLSRRVRVSESVDIALRNATRKLYNLESQKLFFLTHYKYHGKLNDQYVHLFVSCKTEEIQPNKEEIYQIKWWTPKQIEENMGTGIFTGRFEKEYEILKRSGLLEKEGCDCECTLKNLIRNKAGIS